MISAFQRVFPLSGAEKVGLVIKVSHTNTKNKDWIKLKAKIKADPRIHLIDATLRRPEVLALYRCCDCYVSLHRAEGFGRSLAEALLLDLQLIATDYSGNLDFCKKDRVGLVRYKSRELKPMDYFHAKGQFWAEPDINHAAELMSAIYAQPKCIRPNRLDFSPLTIGARYAERLHEIKLQLNLTEEICPC